MPDRFDDVENAVNNGVNADHYGEDQCCGDGSEQGDEAEQDSKNPRG